MILNLTTPIIVEGHHVAELEAAVEVTVTWKGTRPSHDYPGDGPEWNVVGYFLDVGGWVKPHHGKSVWRANLIPCPDSLKGFIEAYMDTTEGRDSIICSLQDCGEAV